LKIKTNKPEIAEKYMANIIEKWETNIHKTRVYYSAFSKKEILLLVAA
jgi:ribosomal protein S17E